MRAVFDTNILIDLLNGRVEANHEAGRYSGVAITRISWMEVLSGARNTEDQNRVENLLIFEMIEWMNRLPERRSSCDNGIGENCRCNYRGPPPS